jgi:tetratricopeptide (TPR) repeat protein
MTDVEELRAEAWAEVARAVEIANGGDLEGALTTLDAVVARFGEASDPLLARAVASAIWHQARSWNRLSMPERRMSALRQLTEGFASSTDAYPAHLVTRALYFRALDRHTAGDLDEADALYDETLRRARGVTEPLVRDAAMHATVGKARLMSSRGRHERALRLLDERLGDLEDLIPSRPDYLGTLLLTKLYVLDRAADDPEAVAVADRLIDRLAGSADHGLRVQVAHALLQKAVSLGRLGRPGEQEDVLGLVLDRFAAEALEALDWRIANVEGDPGWQRGLAGDLLLRASVLYELGRPDESAEAFNALIDQFGGDTDIVVAAVIEQARAARVGLGL